MGRDRRTYRFVKDTRNGRVVLAEVTEDGADRRPVTRYVAERMVEREHLIEGDAHAAVEGVLRCPRNREPMRRQTRTAADVVGLLSGLWVLLAGAGVGLIALAVVLFWDRLSAMLQQ